MRLLIVEDDHSVATSLQKGLSEAGYEVLRCASAEDAVNHFEAEAIDLVVLDLGLPGRDGFHVLNHVRERPQHTPVVILTARDTIDDKVRGLDAGADDYLVKPFAFPELLARIRANLRRAGDIPNSVLRVADLEIDAIGRTAQRAGTPVELTAREFDLLHYLASHTARPVSRDMLARDVWKISSRATPLDNVIDVHICHLRNAIDSDSSDPLIHTIRGVGFVLESRL